MCSRETTGQRDFVVDADGGLRGAEGGGVGLEDRWSASTANRRARKHLISLGGEIGPRWTGCVGEAPRKERVVNELHDHVSKFHM